MKILSRYVLREFLQNMAFGLLIFTFILVLDRLFEIIDLLLNKGASLILILKLFMVLLPSFLTLTLPMAFLLAALLTFGHLSDTNEITALRASGLSLRAYTLPVLIVALLGVGFLLPFNMHVAPKTEDRFRTIYLKILQNNPLLRLEQKTFLQIGAHHLYVDKIHPKTKAMKGVNIYKIPDQGPPLRIFAREGQARAADDRTIQFDLTDGNIQQVNPEKPDVWNYSRFDRYTLTIPIELNNERFSRSIKQMSMEELRGQARKFKGTQVPTGPFLTEIHTRIALAVTPLLFVALGIPLALKIERGTKSIGFGVSLGVLFAYYILLSAAITLGEKDKFPPQIGLWIPNICTAIAAGWFFWKASKR